MEGKKVIMEEAQGRERERNAKYLVEAPVGVGWETSISGPPGSGFLPFEWADEVPSMYRLPAILCITHAATPLPLHWSTCPGPGTSRPHFIRPLSKSQRLLAEVRRRLVRTCPPSRLPTCITSSTISSCHLRAPLPDHLAKIFAPSLPNVPSLLFSVSPSPFLLCHDEMAGKATF